MDMQRGFRIGSWDVSPLKGEIASAGTIVHLEPKVMEVLIALAEKAERVVLREELLDKVWGARAAVSDEPLTRCIAQLRQSLGDSSRSPQFIQTVPKRGYRLMMPAQLVDEPAEHVPAEKAMPENLRSAHRTVTANAATRTPWQLVGLAAAIGVLALLGLTTFNVLPLILSPDEVGLDLCDIESDANWPARVSDEARELCEIGINAMNTRSPDTLIYAMHNFREAIAIEPSYGSAIANLARAMALLPTYDNLPLLSDCRYDENLSDQVDCYDGAFKLLARKRSVAPYIDPYVYDVEGYVFAKQHRWQESEGAFESPYIANLRNADMWQWITLFRASVGDLAGALEAIETAYDLNPSSGVILDRYGVLLMWDDQLDRAEEMFARARRQTPVINQAAQLVFNIRRERWDEVREILMQHAGVNVAEDSGWIDIFIGGLKGEVANDIAVDAVEAAIERTDLWGQYAYGALVFLEQPERAIDEAMNLVASNPTALDVEFLYTQETKILRDHEDFGRLLRALRLDTYWANGNCPALFNRPDETPWCD